MLTDVVTPNAKIQPPELILMITKAIQTNVEDDANVIIIPIEKKVAIQSQTLDHLNPPKVDKRQLDVKVVCMGEQYLVVCNFSMKSM
jgi:hypothetical protein